MADYFPLLGTLLLSGALLASASPVDVSPVAALSYGAFQGNMSGNVSSFRGVPYAAPPLGDLRFAPPQAPQQIQGVYRAMEYGAACPQQATPTPPGLPFSFSFTDSPIAGVPPIANISEDCLFVNVVKPQAATPGADLPVLLWLHGGGLEIGSSSLYPGEEIVERSIAIGEPVVFVSANYRLNAFGFLAGEEVQQAGLGNIGLRDQRFAMQWIQSNINAFGGDGSKLIIWGESAGAMSVGLHMVWNDGNTNGLFRGGFMESGSPGGLSNMSAGQPYYDYIVQFTGCEGQSDTLDCLRHAPYDQLMTAVNNTPNQAGYRSLNTVWSARIDGSTITRNPPRSLEMGLFADIPFVTGDVDDEATIFNLGNTNVTTDEEFVQYLKSNFMPDATAEDLNAIANAYPSDPRLGSPYDTGSADQLTPQYKRLSAFGGDYTFQAPRRFLLGHSAGRQDTWAFLYKRNKTIPYLGSHHMTDIPEFFTGIDYIGTDALINFAYNLNPNVPSTLAPNVSYLSNITWEQWNSSTSAPPLFTFLDPAPSVTISSDTYRAAAMDLLNEMTAHSA